MWIDDIAASNRTPLTVDDLQAGHHRVRLEHSGLVIEKEVLVPARQTVKFVASFQEVRERIRAREEEAQRLAREREADELARTKLRLVLSTATNLRSGPVHSFTVMIDDVVAFRSHDVRLSPLTEETLAEIQLTPGRRHKVAISYVEEDPHANNAWVFFIPTGTDRKDRPPDRFFFITPEKGKPGTVRLRFDGNRSFYEVSGVRSSETTGQMYGTIVKIRGRVVENH